MARWVAMFCLTRHQDGSKGTYQMLKENYNPLPDLNLVEVKVISKKRIIKIK
jgi:hypothetical protein